MRAFAIALILLCAPALAAEHSPWGDAPEPPSAALIQLAQAKPGAPRTSGPACCKRCGFSNKRPCGDYCIDTKAACSFAPGCACP